MRCRCCEKILSPSYIKSGDKHCSACSRAIAAGSSYSEVVSEMAEIAKDRGVILRLERLADRHRNEEMLGMSANRADALKKVRDGIRPMRQRLNNEGEYQYAKWWCSTCNIPLTKKRCLRCELAASRA
jgi:hypothetical protein